MERFETVFKNPLRVREVLQMLNGSESLYGDPGAKVSILFTDMEILDLGGGHQKVLHPSYSLTLPEGVTCKLEKSLDEILSHEFCTRKFFDTPLTYGDVYYRRVAFVEIFPSITDTPEGASSRMFTIMLYIPGLAKAIEEKRQNHY